MDTDKQATDFSDHVLGETRGKIIVDTREANRLALLQMARQSTNTLRITSRDLDAGLYDNDEFLAAARELTLRTRRAHIYILVNNVDRIIKHGHRLVNLYRRLTSFIDIRVQGKRFEDYNEATLIADACGYVRRQNADRYEAEIDFNSPRTVRDMIKQFEEMWSESETDINLSRLHI